MQASYLTALGSAKIEGISIVARGIKASGTGAIDLLNFAKTETKR